MKTTIEAEQATLKYFDGDELATNVWITKYALKDKAGELQELTPSKDDVIIYLNKEDLSSVNKIKELYNLL